MSYLIFLLAFFQFAVPTVTGAGRGASTPVLPTANLLAAYDPSSLSASPVASWPDSSSNANTLTSTGAANPVWSTAQTPHGHPAVTFNGTSNYFGTLATIACTSNCTIYMVFKPQVVNVKQSATSSTGGSTLVYALNSSAEQTLELQQTSVIGTDTTVLSAGTWYRLAVSWNGTTWQFYVNGTMTASGSNATTVMNGINRIGANTSGGSSVEFLNGEVGFLAFYNTGYNSAVDTYLGTI